MNETLNKKLRRLGAVLLFALTTLALSQAAAAQDQQDDPPDRVARLGYLQGSVSMQPAGESEWVGAVSNRPMTTGDKLWADQDSRAEVNLGSAVIRLSANTGFSLLNLDDRTVQIQLTSGTLNLRVRRLSQDDLFEIDTPNQAFSVFRPGNYRVEASEDGNYTVVSVREGDGESTGNGQTYTLHTGQRGTFSGTDSLNAEVDDIGRPDRFDDWCYGRDRRFDDSRSARYVSPEVVGYEDLDEYGDWRDDSNYGHVWYPTRVSSGWAPYREGHWDWISPWGWTWVDDSPWGYAPFHYGRWIVVGGRWGWIAGPVAVRPVYAPALVVFIGGGGGFGGNVGWFPLGPREVYVPSYHVSRGYVERVNVSNTNVNVTNVTNVYNTTIINKTTNITNVTYVNRNVQGAVTAVPQRTFVSAQPVGQARVAVNERDIASAQMTARVAVAPTRESVLGARANTANRVTAPPAAIANRQVIAKAPPPPPPVSFARQQQALAQHPGEPLARREVQNLRPAAAPEAHPMVKIAPPGKPATPNTGGPGNRPNQVGNQPRNERPDQPGSAPSANRPNAAPSGQPVPAAPNNPSANRPGNDRAPNDRSVQGNATPADRPGTGQQNRPAPPSSSDRSDQSWRNNRPDANRPQPAVTPEPAVRNDRAPADQPGNRPDTNRPNNRPDVNRPVPPAGNVDRTPADQPANRPETNRPNNRPDTNRPEPATRNDRTPADQPARNDRPPSKQDQRPDANPPNNRQETNRQPDAERNPPNNRAETPRSQSDRPADRPVRNNRDPEAQPNNRPNGNQPAARTDTPDRPPNRTAPAQTQPPPDRERPQHKQTPEEKKQEQERQKREQEKPPTG
jgi:hypothetical protein